MARAGETPAETDERTLSLARLLEEAPAHVDLPALDPQTVALPGGLETFGPGATGEPVDDWGCLLAGLSARYTQTTGPVVVTLATANRFTPVTVDLSADPELEAARDAWRSARTEQESLGLDEGAFALLAADHPAAAQVVVVTGSAEWPSENLPALCLDLTDPDRPALLVGGAARPDVDAHLAALATGWARPATRLSEVALLSPEELARLRTAGRGPEQEVGDATVWSLVAGMAAQRPDAEAVRDVGRSLDYGDLVAEVEAVAAELVRVGIRSGSLVGLCVERSARMVVSMLAVHRCGAAYVPIDASYPADRIAMMVEDADLAAVLTERPLLDRVDAPDLPRVLVDEDLPSAEDLLAGVEPAGPEDLAYVIFTSGSTGRPKGVAIGQRALANFALSMARCPGVRADDRLLAVTTLSFDIAELELLVPLTVGGCVVVADRPTTLDPGALAARLEADDVTVMQATPATWRMLLDDGWPGRSGLRILCGGEALPRSLADELVPRCAELWNMYGPTETTIWSMVGQVSAGGGDLTIGAPIHNTTVAVADRWLNAVPDGVAGELLIGGDGVARGYLGRPDLTAERFVPDRLTGTSGAIYRTGDLVRRNPGRGMEFIGRIDGQVKVRGFRIELAEVETALEAHPGVVRAVAVTRPDPASGANRLLGYVVTRDQVDGTELRRHAGTRVPEYMVPSVVTVLDQFPLTLNGKVDRAALPDPEPVRARGDHVAPRTALEGQLVSIWEHVLRVDGVGVTDDVFDLGTSSLTTARLYATISRELGVELPIAGAFQARTVEALAALVDELRGGGGADDHRSLVPIRTTGTRRPLFLVHGGAGTVLLFEPLARRLSEDQPVYALQAAGLYGGRAPQTSVDDMADLYLEELAAIQPHGPYRIGGYCFGALVAFEMAARLEARGEEVELLITFNGPSPSYLRRYKPIFDGEGARTDESGRIVRGRGRSIHPRELQRRHRAGEPVGGLARSAARIAARRGVNRLRGWRRRARIELAVRTDRPLPDELREAGVFQQLAARAQDRYQPGTVRADMLVVAGDGLYYRDDIGWRDHVAGSVDVLEVVGSQLTPRASMRAESVGPIVDAVADRLDRLDRQDAAEAPSAATSRVQDPGVQPGGSVRAHSVSE